MDGEQFDAIIRKLRTEASRRRVLASLVGGAAPVVIGPLATAKNKKKKKPCGTGAPCRGAFQKCCSLPGGAATCLDTSSDPQNCGKCNNVCDEDEVCANGRCRSNCPGDQVRCGADRKCVNLKTDTVNCGACGKACLLNEMCVEGTCKCDGQTCMKDGSPICCANGASCCGTPSGCCPRQGICVNDMTACCPRDKPTFCPTGGHGEGGCCPPDATCCDGKCCPGGATCTNNLCCPNGTHPCAGGWCCPDGKSCTLLGCTR